MAGREIMEAKITQEEDIVAEDENATEMVRNHFCIQISISFDD